jgi:hypothetical protein
MKMKMYLGLFVALAAIAPSGCSSCNTELRDTKVELTQKSEDWIKDLPASGRDRDKAINEKNGGDSKAFDNRFPEK